MSESRLMAWWPAGREAGTTSLAGLAGRVEVFRAAECSAEIAYFALPVDGNDAVAIERAVRAACRTARVTRQRLLQACEGASAGTDAAFHYVVSTDVRPEAEEDFNAWYVSEHLPGLASVPGTVRARRFRNDDDAPRYHACYDLATAETLGSPPWLAVRGTPWSSRVRPAFCNTTRLMLRRV
ncbi:MAG: DUF4286 family protein [Burkholderiales bacterium]